MDKFNIKLDNIQELHLEMGYKCNLRCTMCFQKDYTQTIDQQVWQKKLLPLYPNLKRLIIQGGEPTVIKECDQLIDLVLQKNPKIKFGTMTNGLLFDQKWQQLFVKHGYMVNFSLNAYDKNTFEKINRYSNYDKVMENLQSLIDLRNQSGSELEIYASYVILPDNIRQISDFIKQGVNLGIDKIRFFFDASNLPNDTKLVEESIGQALQIVRINESKIKVEGLVKFYQYYCFKKKIKNNYSQYKELIPFGCKAPWTSLYVDHLGRVEFCCMSNLVLGDLAKDNLADIINNKKAIKFRKKMLKHNFSYCQATCLLNTKPNYGFSLSQLKGHIGKFITDFKRSPKVALRKTWRKIKELI